MPDPRPPRLTSRFATLLAIVLTAAAALAWAALILSGPRSAFRALALHFFIAALVSMGGALAGYLVTRLAASLDLLERLVLGFALALALVMMATFALGLLGLISGAAAILAALLILGVLGGIVFVRDVRALHPSPLGEGGPSGRGEGLRPKTVQKSPWTPAAWLIVGLIVVLALLLLYASWGECVDYDALEYHAGVPAQWLRAGGIINLPGNIYSYFPMASEMLNLFAMGLFQNAPNGAALGKLLGGLCAVWAALAVVCVGRRLFSLRAGLAGAALFLTIPWIFNVSLLGLVEGVQTFFTLAALAAAAALLLPGSESECATVGLSDRANGGAIPCPPAVRGQGVSEVAHSARRNNPPGQSVAPTSGSLILLAALLGLLAGLTASIKMTNLAFVLPPAALAVIVAVRRCRLGWKPLAAFLLAAALFAAPFYVRNFVLTGNPFFPVLSTVLGGPAGWTSDLAARFTQFHSPGPFTLEALWTALAGHASADSAPGDSYYYSFAVLFLIPFALVRRQARRRTLALLALVVFMIAAWFCGTHRIGRLLVPAWGLLAVVAGAGLEAFDAVPARAVLAAAVILIARFDLATDLQMGESNSLYVSMIGDAARPLGPDGRYDFKFDPNTAGSLWDYSPWTVRMINDLGAHRPGLKVGLIGEGRTLYFDVPVVYNTVFNRSWMALQFNESPISQDIVTETTTILHLRGVTHIYVNWAEIDRFSSAGNYGWPAWLDRALLDRLEQSGAIRKLRSFGPPHQPPEQVIYEVM